MAKRRTARPGEAFVFQNGQTAETVAELVARLEVMDPADFRQYVNEQKNDIYNWLRDCLDPRLAEKVRNVVDREKMISILK